MQAAARRNHPGVFITAQRYADSNMLRRAVVCFANVQEGRDPKVLRELSEAAASVPGILLPQQLRNARHLHSVAGAWLVRMFSDRTFHRSGLCIVGVPESVGQVASPLTPHPMNGTHTRYAASRPSSPWSPRPSQPSTSLPLSGSPMSKYSSGFLFLRPLSLLPAMSVLLRVVVSVSSMDITPGFHITILVLWICYHSILLVTQLWTTQLKCHGR